MPVDRDRKLACAQILDILIVLNNTMCFMPRVDVVRKSVETEGSPTGLGYVDDKLKTFYSSLTLGLDDHLAVIGQLKPTPCLG